MFKQQQDEGARVLAQKLRQTEVISEEWAREDPGNKIQAAVANGELATALAVLLLELQAQGFMPQLPGGHAPKPAPDTKRPRPGLGFADGTSQC